MHSKVIFEFCVPEFYHVTNRIFCVISFSETYNVFVGSHDLTNGGATYGIERVLEHPEYNRFGPINDVALIKTSSKIEFNNRVRSIVLDPREIGIDESLTFSKFPMKKRLFDLVLTIFFVTHQQLVGDHRQQMQTINGHIFCKHSHWSLSPRKIATAQMGRSSVKDKCAQFITKAKVHAW